MLTKAKETLVSAIESAQNSPMGQAVSEKINAAQAQAQAKIDELKGKMGGAKTE